VPISVYTWWLIGNVLNCRPDFDSIGLDETYWLGFDSNPNQMSDAMTSALGAIIDEVDAQDDDKAQTEDSRRLEELECNLASKVIYRDFSSPSDEVNIILNEVHRLVEKNNIENTYMANSDSIDFSRRVNAMMSRLNMNSDASPGYMSILNTLRYGIFVVCEILYLPAFFY